MSSADWETSQLLRRGWGGLEGEARFSLWLTHCSPVALRPRKPADWGVCDTAAVKRTDRRKEVGLPQSESEGTAFHQIRVSCGTVWNAFCECAPTGASVSSTYKIGTHIPHPEAYVRVDF